MSEDHKPKYQQIVAFLNRAIAIGEYQPGQKLPSEADLVERFSTSRLTVQRALKELQHQDLIERRAGSGTYVRQSPSSEKKRNDLLVLRLMIFAQDFSLGGELGGGQRNLIVQLSQCFYH